MTLILTYKDYQSSFQELLEKYHFSAAHHKNLYVLNKEIFKIKDLGPNIMKNEFLYDLQSESNHFKCRNTKTIYYGLLSIKYLAPQIWELVPQRVKKCNTLNELKTKIKTWYPDRCQYRLCITYIAQLGFT